MNFFITSNARGSSQCTPCPQSAKCLGLLAAPFCISDRFIFVGHPPYINGDGGTDALTDGLLLLRYLFGFEGATLIEGAVGDGAERTHAGDVESFINSRIADGSD